MAKTLERMVVGLIAPFDAAHLQIMIDHDWYIVETVRWTAQHQADHVPDYPPELSQEEKDRIEALRKQTIRMALAALGFSRVVVSRFPKPLVDQYLNVGYASKWLKKHRPDLLPVLETEKGAQWLQNEVENDIKPYLWPSKTREEKNNATS
ncbi:hypothetical protein KEJ15_04030 [Candidatus Bathyarchaeota archaeon]|nr:hypothetical protein [Candidatus Bathyarchaeota archaeon]